MYVCPLAAFTMWDDFVLPIFTVALQKYGQWRLQQVSHFWTPAGLTCSPFYIGLKKYCMSKK